MCKTFQGQPRDLAEKFGREERRMAYVTPTSYLQLISTFKALLNSQRTEVLDAKNRYDNGLQKIAETQVQVDEMQKVLVDLQPKLKEATIATDRWLIHLQRDLVLEAVRVG